MNIYNLIFVEFYEFRKKFRTDNNKIWSATFVTTIQAMQISCVLSCISIFGLKGLIIRSIPVVFAAVTALYIANQAYFFSSLKAQDLIDKNKMLEERSRMMNGLIVVIVIIITIVAFFVVPQLSFIYNKNYSI